MNEALTALIKPLVEGFGYELWGMEYLARGKYSILTVYIDVETGIGVDDCAKISRQVSDLLDVEDALKGTYTLEVSSPGMRRRLFTLAQFDSYKGAQIKISLRTAYKGKRQFLGLLCGVEEGDIVLRVKDEEYLFPFYGIDRANLVPAL